MKVYELFESSRSLSYLGFRLEQIEEHEDDNIKIWHTVILPNGQKWPLDHSPYQFIDLQTFKLYVLFYKQHKRFPGRDDINSVGPLDDEDVHKLMR